MTTPMGAFPDPSFQKGKWQTLEILVRHSAQDDLELHCRATIVKVSDNGKHLLCGLPCPQKEGRTYHLELPDQTGYIGISLLEDGEARDYVPGGTMYPYLAVPPQKPL